MSVCIIGMGPGGHEYLLPIAKERIMKADCLVGAARLIRLFHYLGKKEVLIKGDLNKALSYIRKNKSREDMAVLVSGDPGINSFFTKVTGILKHREYEVIPGISTIQLAFARAGQPWSDARIISLHGRDINNLADKVRGAEKAFIFTDPSFPPGKIAAQLLKDGLENRRAIVLENLSYPDERITNTDLTRLSKMKGFGLCAMIIETKRNKARGKPCTRAMQGRLYGVGIGPGDPALVTLKAKGILDRAATVFVPKSSEDGKSIARSIVESVTGQEKNFVELTFPMTRDKAVLAGFWEKAALRISKEISKGKDVAFVTIGDPFIYSTYVYLLKTLRSDFPDIPVETVPGISAFNASAAAARCALVKGDEGMAIVPVKDDMLSLRKTLQDFDTVVLMKVGSKLGRVTALLKELNLIKNAILISRVGHKDERIIHNLKNLRDKKAGYLSVIIVKKEKT